MKILNLYFVLATIVASAKCQLEVPVVQTTFGPVRGIYEETEDLQFFLYMGIPYAQHPPGNIFGDPVDPTPWDDIFEADNDAIYCPHRRELTGTLLGSMDCLIANVYIPENRTSSDALPVFFWLFGGAFYFGSGDRNAWGPEFLVQQDIIVVMINYRVGPFGFICLGTEDIPGNAGYKDIIKALRWVRDNIAGFGGDPNQVTIGGLSSGSVAAESLIASPASSDLFKSAILQSGSVFTTTRLYAESHHQYLINMAHYFGYKGGSIKGCIKFLQEVEPIDIYVYTVGAGVDFSICIEENLPGVENFMPDIPAKILESGQFTPVNVLLGYVSKEVAFTIFDFLDDSYAIHFQNAIAFLKFSSDEERSNVAKILRSFYIGSQAITNDVRDKIEDLLGDYIFIYPTYRSAVYHELQNVTVYLYRFEYSGGRDYSKTLTGFYDVNEPIHADELGYLFNQTIWPAEIALNDKADDKLIIDRMTTMWGNFVKYGDPTPEVTELLPVKWLPFQTGSYHTLNINTTMTTAVDQHRESFAFWDLIYKKYLPYNLD